MSYHSKLTKANSMLITLKIRLVILFFATFTVWVFGDLLTSILLSIVLIGYAIYTTYDVISIGYIIKKLKKLADKEDQDLKEELNNMFRQRKQQNYQRKTQYSNKDINSMFNDLLNQILNEHFNQNNHQRQNVVRPVNREKVKNAYKLLRLSESDSVEKIKKTYKSLAIKWHPDKWTTSTEQNKATALRNFKKLQAAYDLIKKDKNIV